MGSVIGGHLLTQGVCLQAFPDRIHRDACMKIENQPVSFLILLAILILLRAILQSILLKLRRQSGIQEHKPKTPRPLKPKTEDDCPFCREEKGSCVEKPGTCPTPHPWAEVRNRRGRKKSTFTQGQACNNPKCIYYHIIDERIHALVGYGSQASTRRSRI